MYDYSIKYIKNTIKNINLPMCEPVPEKSEDELYKEAYRSYWNSYKVDLENLMKIRDSLMKVSKLSPRDIMDTWIEPDEDPIEDFDHIEYQYDMPLYKKMILRFQREGRRDPACFIKQLDPSNQQRISYKFGVWDSKLFEFFAYIKNNYGIYDIRDMGLSEEEWKKLLLNSFITFPWRHNKSL